MAHLCRSRRADIGLVGRASTSCSRRSRIRATKCSSRCRPIRSITAILHKIGAREVYYRTDPKNGWQPDPKEIRSLITPRTKALVVNDPNNPTGAVVPHSRFAASW